MRSEKEMMELILSVARKDERIRAVYMNGSRTNPNVKKDIFQDYDIVYVVKENRPFMKTKDGSTDLENDFICNVQKRWIRIADRQWISINVLDG